MNQPDFDTRSREGYDSPKPRVRLTGTDGNVFLVIARCCVALKKAQMADREEEFRKKAFNASSYDEVLGLATQYCEIS